MKEILVSVMAILTIAITAHAQTKTIYINSTKKECTGVAPMQCFQYKTSPDEDWKLLYQPIEGFSYQEGYLYTLRVKTIRITNPPADGSSVRYILKKVISKQKDNTMNSAMAQRSVEGKWIISAILTSGKLTEVSDKGWEMEFLTAEQMAAAGLCNRMNGGFTLQGNQIKFGPMRSTKMMCPDMDLETAFSKAITEIDNYAFDANRLLLKKGNEILVILSMPV